MPSPLPPSFPSLPSSGSSPAAAVSRNWFRTGSSALSRTRPLRNEPARRTRDGTRTKPKDRLSLPAAQLAPASPRLVTSGGGDDDDQSARGSCVSSRVKGSPPPRWSQHQQTRVLSPDARFANRFRDKHARRRRTPLLRSPRKICRGKWPTIFYTGLPVFRPTTLSSVSGSRLWHASRATGLGQTGVCVAC